MSDPAWPMSRRVAVAREKIANVMTMTGQLVGVVNHLPEYMDMPDFYEAAISRIRELAINIEHEITKLPEMTPDEEVTA